MPRIMSVTKKCSMCSRTLTIHVDPVDYLEWQHGALIQKIMPYLTEGERELLISDICTTCFDSLFNNEEDE
jgi:hypothetical protein